MLFEEVVKEIAILLFMHNVWSQKWDSHNLEYLVQL